MIYAVDVSGHRMTVETGPEGVRIDGGPWLDAELLDVPGSPTQRLRVGPATYEIVVRRGAERGHHTVVLHGQRFVVEALDEHARAIRSLARAAAVPAGPTLLRAPMPGLIVRVTVAPGDVVQPGQGLVVIEAMKMENELVAPAGGTVRAVRVTPGRAVEKGTVLVEVD